MLLSGAGVQQGLERDQGREKSQQGTAPCVHIAVGLFFTAVLKDKPSPTLLVGYLRSLKCTLSSNCCTQLLSINKPAFPLLRSYGSCTQDTELSQQGAALQELFTPEQLKTELGKEMS